MSGSQLYDASEFPMSFVVSVEGLYNSPKSRVDLMYRITCFSNFQCVLPGFCANREREMTEKRMSGLVAMAR